MDIGADVCVEIHVCVEIGRNVCLKTGRGVCVSNPNVDKSQINVANMEI